MCSIFTCIKIVSAISRLIFSFINCYFGSVFFHFPPICEFSISSCYWFLVVCLAQPGVPHLCFTSKQMSRFELDICILSLAGWDGQSHWLWAGMQSAQTRALVAVLIYLVPTCQASQILPTIPIRQKPTWLPRKHPTMLGKLEIHFGFFIGESMGPGVLWVWQCARLRDQ